ncbi:MAG: hypothetical protein ABIP30_13470 [Ferruginibacter sp.]
MEKIERKFHVAFNKIYFRNATINECQPLLQNDLQKQTIIESLKTLSDKKLITIYGFVIMPNHIQLACLPAGRYGSKMI